MSAIAGILNVADPEHAFISNIGQGLVFDAINELMLQYNEELAAATSIFIEDETEKFKFRHLLPGGGRLQQMGHQAPAGAMKRDGSYDVALPLRHWGVEIAGTRVDMAYMTVQELDTHLENVMQQNLNTLRWRILTALFEDTNLTYLDEHHGALTVTRLANTDGTLYPPVLGSETESDDDHYSETAYNVAAIADANNPVVTLRNEIAEHFGGIGSGGREFVYLHGADQTAYLAAITGFVAIEDQYVASGDNTALVRSYPAGVPGRCHGRLSGAHLFEWDGWIPDTYGLMILRGVPAPLYRRHDPAATGLGRGLQLVAKDVNHPIERSSFENRYGLGVVNRLSAACIEISGGGGTYAVPDAYSE